jgi:phosphohistidine phosphatase
MGTQTLILVRHGKAVSSIDEGDDFARDLTARGVSDVRALGKALLDKGHVPDCILSSPACRTAQTARLLALELGLDPDRDIEYEASLYLGSTRQVEEGIRACMEKVKCLLYVGHNPEIGSLAMHWSAGQAMQFPTAACIVFDWNGREATGTFLYHTPR